MILGFDGKGWIVTSSEYDEATQTYTVKLSETTIYKVKIVEQDGKEIVTIEQVVQEEEAV
jgi:hypothetical protein